MDEAPTVALRELLRSVGPDAPHDAIERALDEIDQQFDFVAGQRRLFKGRSEWLAAEAHAGRGWRVVEAVERLLTRMADVARQRRMAAIEDHKERGTA